MSIYRTSYLSIAAILVFSFGTGCQEKKELVHARTLNSLQDIADHRPEMRKFIRDISDWARARKPGFLIVPQDGLALLTSTGDASGTPITDYIKLINGIGQEELYYGYQNNDDLTTPPDIHDQWLRLCEIARDSNLKVLITDYCFSPEKIIAIYQANEANGFISYAARRKLDNIATGIPYRENANDITSLADAKNFLYLIDTHKYASDQQFLQALQATNFDVIIMDAFFNGGIKTFTYDQIQRLKTKQNGGKRLVISYMSIAQAETYRWYWKPEWIGSHGHPGTPPEWLEPNVDPNWAGNYNVRYWMSEWQTLIFGNDSSYTKQILDAGFDGAYLDLYDYERWQ